MDSRAPKTPPKSSPSRVKPQPPSKPRPKGGVSLSAAAASLSELIKQQSPKLVASTKSLLGIAMVSGYVTPKANYRT